jgi:excisionase family DNA binding protein
MDQLPTLLSILQCGRELGCSRSKVYLLIQGGELDTVHIGRLVRISRRALEAYIERLEAASGADIEAGA